MAEASSRLVQPINDDLVAAMSLASPGAILAATPSLLRNSFMYLVNLTFFCPEDLLLFATSTRRTSNRVVLAVRIRLVSLSTSSCGRVCLSSTCFPASFAILFHDWRKFWAPVSSCLRNEKAECVCALFLPFAFWPIPFRF